MSEASPVSVEDSLERARRCRFIRFGSIVAATCVATTLLLTYAAYLTVSLPDVGYLEKQNPDDTSVMRQRWAEARREGRQPRRVQAWVPLDRISERLVQAVIMGEDAAFFSHRGFDFYEIRESILRNVERRRFTRGASTITQQLAKNLFLSTEKSLHRKLAEAILTYRLEKALSKRRILEIYLNVIEWGEDIYGAEAAARTYLAKSAARLDAAEAASLAAMIPSPRRLSRAEAEQSLKTRQERILDWMRMAGELTEEEYRQAKAKPLNLRRPVRGGSS